MQELTRNELPGYTAIVLGYQRPKELLRVVKAIQNQTVKPQEIIVWHNGMGTPLISGRMNIDETTDGYVDVINIRSQYNFGCRARHAIGQLVKSPWCLFVDDDVLLGPQVAEKLLRGACRLFYSERMDSVIGYCGVVGTKDDLYTTAKEIYYPTEDTPVSVVKGRVHMIYRLNLGVAFDSPDVFFGFWEDDIILCARIKIALGGQPWLIGGIGHNEITNLDTQDGLDSRPDHYARRDAAWINMVKHGWNPSPEDDNERDTDTTTDY